MLSSRRQQILSALIQEYVAHACPVGSRTIAENHHVGVSPATIRNELSALEEAGYITQPHTSAGRIPTDAGYREFVDNFLAQARPASTAATARTIQKLRSSADALDTLIQDMNAELARMTQCLSLIMAPSTETVRVLKVSLVALSDYSVLAVVVAEDGNVANETVTLPAPLDAGKLTAIEHALNKALSGTSVTEVAQLVSTLPLLNTPDMQGIAHGIEKAIAALTKTYTTHSGMSALLRKPEFHNAENILPVMEILEDDTVLFKAITNEGAEQGDIRIRIGHENASELLSGVSVIAGMYGKEGAQGVIAIIGPTRMDYTKTISAVRAAQNVLSGE